MPSSTQHPSLTIYVEGQVDKQVVEHLLHAAGIASGVSVEVRRGKNEIKQQVAGLRDSEFHKHIALVDADEISVPDSEALARRQLGYPSIAVFCAVPTIEAWLFADDVAARNAARSKQAVLTLERVPLPELIPYPKQLAANVFAKRSSASAYSFVREVDISRASARSPSLRAFLSGVAHALGTHLEIAANVLSQTVSRDAISTLLRELPGNSVAWKTMEGASISAGQLAKDVVEGTDLGKQYATEVLRVARDIVARRSTI